MTNKVKRRGESLLKLSLGRGAEPSSLDEERPSFSFRYLSMEVSVKKCDNKVFRYDSDNHAFVGVVRGNTIYPIFIEATFGDVYDHH